VSDRPVSKEEWRLWFGDMPYPEGATHEMLIAARDALETIEEKEEDLRLLQWWQKQKKDYEVKIADWKTRTNEPNYYERLRVLEENLKLIDEGIEVMLERLAE
jgi:hypothetical protein